MIDLFYPTLHRTGPSSWTLEAIPSEDGYLWHYWLPAIALLCPERFTLRASKDLSEQSFVFPLELRWEFLDRFAELPSDQFLTPAIPAWVLERARTGRAIVLVFFA